MTKVIILGQEPEKKKGKPIEFVKRINMTGKDVRSVNEPSQWENVEVTCFNYQGSGYDLFFAYDGKDRKLGVAYLGHYNDGIVE